MVKWWLHRRLRKFERKFGYDASYMHELLDTDASAFIRFGMATGALGSYRKDLPAEVYMAAGLTGSMHADCGPCTQLGVDFALSAGVPAAAITAVVKGDDEKLSADTLLGARFARAIIARSGELDALREQVEARWGKRAVASMTYAVMTAQLYPALKYATGHGKACVRVKVDGTFVQRGGLARAA